MPNGSFEEYEWCPQGVNDFGAVSHWYNVTLATPDYYNSCADNGAGVPVNDWGFQYANSGQAYAGLFWIPDSNLYREYIGVRLIEPLTSNQVYCFRMYVSLLDQIDYASNNMGFALSQNQIVDFSTVSNINAPIIHSFEEIIFDSINWTLLEASFQASGGEQYLTIGYFLNIDQSTFIQINENQAGGPGAYYYIDDVWLGLSPSLLVFPNVFTPNDDGSNDYYVPEIQGCILIEWSVFNRWGNRVFSSLENIYGWDGRYLGRMCPEGVYYYSCLYIDSTGIEMEKTGFFHLIR